MGINMGKSVIEDRGRVLIPKEIRQQLSLKPGQEVMVERKEGTVVIKPSIDIKKMSGQLKGCVKKSKIHPMDVKKMWNM